jgi:hypothetical protein
VSNQIPPQPDDRPDGRPERLGETAAFAEELERLAEQAPELCRSELLVLAERAYGDVL